MKQETSATAGSSLAVTADLPRIEVIDPDADIINLVQAMWQLLDDMGADGTSVCVAAKAQARVAYEPFRDETDEMDMPLEEANRILKECGMI